MPTLTFTPPICLPAALGRPMYPAGGPAHGVGAQLPLQGLTLLVVEDSRFAADALRLLSQRSGARLRRAETILAARSHLGVYRPDVVLVDLGLPDGRGEVLIREVAQSMTRPALVLGMSGDLAARAAAMAAGADGFVEKPIAGLLAFQSAILDHLGTSTARPADQDMVTPEPDPVALRDDLMQAAALLGDPQDDLPLEYVTGFVAGIARHAGDPALVSAALDARNGGIGLAPLRRLLADRLAQVGTLPAGFGKARPQPLG